MSDLYDNRFGTVGGIGINLCHELLPKSEWTMPKFGVSPSVVRDDADQPKIWFPWFGQIEIGSMWPTIPKARVIQSAESNDLAHAQDINASSLRVEIVLRSGDQISIEKVITQATAHKLEHPHDSEIRLAYLLIKHPDGNITRPVDPLILRGRGAILIATFPVNYLQEIEHRICHYFEITSISDSVTVASSNLYASRALFQAKRLRSIIEDVEFYSVLEYVNEAALLGFLWAKAEAENVVKPAAIARIKASKESARGGQEGGKTRNKIADKTWRLKATECAKAIYAEDNTLSNSKIATKIASTLSNNPKLPDHEWLEGFVSGLRTSGQIGERIRKPKSKPRRRVI